MAVVATRAVAGSGQQGPLSDQTAQEVGSSGTAPVEYQVAFQVCFL